MSFAVIADGAPDVGLGHLARCSAVATALRVHGHEVSTYAYGAAGPLEFDRVLWRPLEGPPDAAVVVLDTYTLPMDARAALAVRTRLAVFDDGGELPPGAALVIGRSGELGGLRHAPLRAHFWGLPERRVRERVRRVLVTTGGGSLRDVGVDLARAVKDALPDVTVALVRAPLATFEAPSGVALLDAPNPLLTEFLAADIVVTAAGQTSLEAAATGVATVALPLVENQSHNAAALDAAGAALIVAPEAVPGTVAGLDFTRRAELARAAQAAVDGYGALRIAFRLGRLHASGE